MIQRLQRLEIGWRTMLLGVVFYLGFVPLLAVVPRWFPLDPDVASAAAVEGYNNGVAYNLAVLWALVGVAGFALFERLGYLKPQNPGLRGGLPAMRGSTEAPGLHLMELAVVFVAVLFLYFPLFLVQYGPYVEDQVFLNALHRMVAGQQPYVDFEFLYSPLMLYPVYFWTELFGYSMASYYWYLALLEALVFVGLLAVLQRYVPHWQMRYAVFLLISIFLLNTLLGVNQNGVRKLMPVLIILLVTSSPRSIWTLVTGALLLGVQLSYSHEYGTAALAALLALYGVLALRERQPKYLLFALTALLLSASVWYGVSLLLMGGEGFYAYIGEVLYLVERFSAGEAGFRFYWTLNALAFFGLITLACIIVGRGLAKPRQALMSAGDCLLFCGLIYALIVLKSGLNRADLWHLNPALLVLVVAFLLPSAKNLFAYSGFVQRLAVVLIVITAATYLVGLLPTGSYYASGWFRGLRDTLTQQHTANAADTVDTRAPTVAVEQNDPDEAVLELGEYLAEAPRSDLPVVFYGDLWKLGIFAGVPKTDFINDDFLYSDERGRLVKAYLQEQKAIVVMRESSYERLFEQSASATSERFYQTYRPSATKRIASWLSTVHYHGVKLESDVKEQRWERTVGNYVRSKYEAVAVFGEYIVLMPRDRPRLSARQQRGKETVSRETVTVRQSLRPTTSPLPQR